LRAWEEKRKGTTLKKSMGKMARSEKRERGKITLYKFLCGRKKPEELRIKLKHPRGGGEVQVGRR